MKRLKKIVKVGKEIDIDYFEDAIEELVEIGVFENYIANFKKDGATHLIFRTQEGYDCSMSDVYLKGAMIKEETDDEFDKRVNAKKYKEEEKELREKAQYLKLKAKYGDL